MTSPVSEVLPSLWSAATDPISGGTDGISGATDGGGAGGMGGVSSTDGASGSSGDASVGGIDTNGFLKLLVAQLTHQDPMKPADSSTYITEESQFSMVQSMNSLAKQNAAILQSAQMQEATSFIGKSVTYIDSNGVANTGIVSSASPGSDGAVVRVGAVQVPVTSITSVMAATGDPTGTTASTVVSQA